MAGYYHLSVKIIGRGTGRSAVACAAYRSGQALHDERYGAFHDYSAKGGIVRTGIIAPAGAPAWAHDRERLWNEVERAEKRKDAQLAREIELGLPHGLGVERHTALIEEFAREQLLGRGLVVDYAIHAPNRKGSRMNDHAHLMITMRGIGPEGLTGGKDRSLNSREQLGAWRAAWADIQNREYERAGLRDADGQILRVDHRSFESQGSDREPTIHMGVFATALERQGVRTEVGDLNREIQKSNEERERFHLAAALFQRDEVRLLLEQEEGFRRGRDERDPFNP
ncbi:MAG: MobA/MobL family protein [Fimbriimonadaceae bacterium]|nr:MobA/MobL family protein [Fimbriimonadaceae bacterium]